MIVNQDHNHGDYEIHCYEPGKLTVNDTVYDRSVIVSTHVLEEWQPQRFDELSLESFASILALRPEVVLLGTGNQLIFPDPKLLVPFYEAQIGVEVMSTLAACRTFNVLMSESRNVVAGLLIR